MSSKIEALMVWCSQHGIQIDPRVQVIESRSFNSIRDLDSPSIDDDSSTLVCSREGSIEKAATLVCIPKSAILSVKSSFLSNTITHMPYGHGAHLALAFAVYGELLLREESRWFGYLDSLPREIVDIALFWGEEDDDDFSICPTCSSCQRYQDGSAARRWLLSTEAGRGLKGLQEEIRQYYLSVVEPILRQIFQSGARLHQPHTCSDDRQPNHNGGPYDQRSAFDPAGNPSFHGFCHAYSLVSSRAFLVDAYHGLAMVPIADAFNHTNDNHVHMESEYDVCIECGSLSECEHDNEREELPGIPNLPNNPPLHSDSDIDTLEMRTVRHIPPHTEIFNTYGNLPNAALLVRYGFVLDANDWNIVTMPVSGPLAHKLIRAARDRADDEGDNKDNAYKRSSRHPTIIPGGDSVYGIAVGGEHGMQKTSVSRLPESYTFTVGGESATPGDAYGIGKDQDTDPSGLDNVEFLNSVFQHAVEGWNSEPIWDVNRTASEDETETLVYNPATSLSGTDGMKLIMNSDGIISHHLWIYCALIAVLVHLPDLVDEGRLESFKERMLRVQGHLDRARIRGGDLELETRELSPSPDPSMLSEGLSAGTSTVDIGNIFLSHSHSKDTTVSTSLFQAIEEDLRI
ncbi:hypothetical protein BJ138DRAFT_697390 [Hygrophoropsis aurantiaca]|uniref:Uncharacterized protein n=1 Tax=Hygrophoropsis aurantiaca TaxID=72124 RepID=A0ACB8AJB2_9AGAM|nr:hypothetical protein BJ138DRAFT_697390 [Hygrophoropsis aurantiaca]